MGHFFACLSRLKLIRRWGLMRSTQPENDAEHSLQVAMMAHGMALMGRERFGRDVSPEHVLALAVYHDAGEVITGDLPTPIKYHSGEMRRAYHQLEALASSRLLAMLPEDLRPVYQPYLMPEEDTYAWKLVKAADRISAYVKCMEEMRAGNREFEAAADTIRQSIDGIDLPEVQAFMAEFVPSFSLPLDELTGEGEQV